MSTAKEDPGSKSPKVLVLDAFRKKQALPAKENDLKIPCVYRVRGKLIDVNDAGEDIVSDIDSMPTYTLVEKDPCGLGEPSWDMIDRLDPAIDTGCLIVRKHFSLDGAQSYVDGLADLNMGEPAMFFFRVFPHEHGSCYTLCHKAEADGALKHAIVHISKVPVAYDDGEVAWLDAFIIYLADGRVLTDLSVLYPELYEDLDEEELLARVFEGSDYGHI